MKDKIIKNAETFIIALISFALGLGAGSGGSFVDLFTYVSIYAIAYVVGEIVGYKAREG